MENKIRVRSNNKISFILYHLPYISYKLEMVDNIVYFIFNRDEIEDLLMDFHDMLDDKMSNYVELNKWLEIQRMVRDIITIYKKEKM